MLGRGLRRHSPAKLLARTERPPQDQRQRYQRAEQPERDVHLLQQGQHWRSEEIAEQRVHQDVQQRAEAHRREEDCERHVEDATRDSGDDAQARHESTKEHRARPMLLEPAFSAVETLRRESDVATVAIDQPAPGHA